MLMRLQCSSEGEELVYKVNNSFHFLIYSYMRFVLPLIRVASEYKDRVRVAWCHNVGTNIVRRALFKEDDDSYQHWDNVWADIYFQFYQSPGAGKRKNHNVGIGNVKCLEEFSELLPRYDINVDQPWFYSMDTAFAFPIFYKNSQTRAEHRYSFRNKLCDLLRVQVKDKSSKWRDLKTGGHKYLNITSTSTLANPELWGRYAYITDPEINWYKKCTDDRVFYTRDIAACDTSNPYKYNSTAEIPLHSTTPCLAFFWVAENRNATAIHNYSNYTTDDNDLYSGWDPIKTTTLKYGTTTRLDNMPSDHFSIAEPRKHFPSSPSERGYHGYSYANDSTSFHGEVGIVFADMNAKLECRIANNNIYTSALDENNQKGKDSDEDEDDILSDVDKPESSDSKKSDIPNEEANQSFIVRSRLLVVRKFVISNVGEDKFQFTIK